METKESGHLERRMEKLESNLNEWIKHNGESAERLWNEHKSQSDAKWAEIELKISQKFRLVMDEVKELSGRVMNFMLGYAHDTKQWTEHELKIEGLKADFRWLRNFVAGTLVGVIVTGILVIWVELAGK